MDVGETIFKYHMHYDHDFMSGDFGNARIFDLTNYPMTIDPAKAAKGSLRTADKLIR